MKSIFLPTTFLLFSLYGALGQSHEHKANVRNGVVTVYAGDYEATFSYGHRWNLSSLSHGNRAIVSPGGANQFNVSLKEANGSTRWYGGIANPEEVKSVTLYVDDAPHTLPPDAPGENRTIPPGGSYTLEKLSRIGPYEVTLRTTLNSDGIEEEVTFQAVEATDEVGLIYASRFSFSDSFSVWFATVSDGFEEEGSFGKEGGTVVNQTTSSLALFDEQNHVVVLLKTSTEPTREKSSHFIWSTPQRYQFHAKLYPETGDTEPVSTRRHLSVWSTQESESDWREQVRARLQAE